ncbi:DUF3857 domain-containing transglutaminase family protein [Poritiphilus flavus]|uniref:DUF3857 domain-containing protein n=1 Tax=Poritiphilus flavus TaxID=2697053 RepID=A0A6L9EGQ2_9FLAO|nr:DUF3857 domain-containing transglutaminase family protein [Poritiphilus flavus]NAS13990.1 DUF3857 domain-containing protein [Poritiphilus flavus]
MRPFYIYLLLFCSLISFGQEADYRISAISPELLKNANAVYRLDEMKIHLNSSRDMRSTFKQVVTVLNELGNKHANMSVHYDKERKVKSIEAYVYDSNGKELERIKRKDFQDVSAVDGFSLYVDDRRLYYNYTPVQYPYTLEFSYEVETSDTGLFPSWYFLPGYTASVEKSIYSVSYGNESLKPIVKEHHLEGIEVTRTETPGITSFTARNIPAVKKESLSPSFRKIAPKVAIRLPKFHFKGYDAAIDSWDDLGVWIHNHLLKEQTELPEHTKTEIRGLMKGVTDPLEKAKIVYDYVQENTRYISVQIGIGGFKPISAMEVDRVKYGDCKGLSNYAKALLSVVGVDAYYVHVQAGPDKVDFEEDFADLVQGNHAILAIPYNDMYYWVDCTSQVHPFGFVGDFTDDRKVLVVKPDGGEIVKTVSYLNKENHQHTRARLSLNAQGGIQAEVSIQTRGTQYDNHFKIEDDTPEEIDKHYKEYWGNINNLKLESYSFKNDQDSVLFEENVTLIAENYASNSGERILFTPNAFNRNDYVPNRHRTRKLPFEIQRGYMDEDEFEIVLPEGYSIEAMPSPVKVETEFGHYLTELIHEEESGTILYKRSLFIKQGDYSKEKYKAYRAFRKQVAANDNAKIVLIRSKT